MFVDQGVTAVAHMTYAFGLCIVTENAVGVGVTAIPSPGVDTFWDGWLYHTTGVVGLVPGNVGGISAAVEIDSKAMRKFKNSDVMVGVVEVRTEVGAISAVFNLETRILVKLP